MKVLLTFILIVGVVFSSTWKDLGSDIPSPYIKDVISSTHGETTVHFKLTGFHQIPIKTDRGDAFIFKTELGASLLQEGAPDLQKHSAALRIPNNAHMVVEVVESNYIEYTDIVVSPSKGNLNRNINPADVPYNWGKVFQE